MGVRALTLDGGEYAIHGTNRPASVGSYVSYGCIRMLNADIIDLYEQVAVGTRVMVTLSLKGAPAGGDPAMDEDRLNMAIRKFLKEVGVTSQREIERVVREVGGKGKPLRLRMTLTSPDASLEHVVETTIDLG